MTVWWNRQSIRKKLIVSCLIFTLIPLLLLEMVFLNLIVRRNVDAVLSSAESGADKLEFRYEAETGKLERLAVTLKDYSPLDTYLSGTYRNQSEAYYDYITNVHPMLISCGEVYDHITVRVYHERKDIDNFSVLIDNQWESFLAKLFPDGRAAYPAAAWVKSNIRYFTFESIYSYYLAVRSKTYPYDNLYGVSVHADEAFFYEPIASTVTEGALILIVDPEDHILSASDRALAGRTLDQLSLELPTSSDQLRDRERVTLDGKTYFFFQRSANGLRLLYLVDRDWVYSSHRNTTIVLIAVGMALLLLSALLLLIVIHNITDHIAALKQKMTDIDRERIRDLAVSGPEQPVGDEITQLDAVFTGMMRRIDALMEQTQQQEARLKDAVIMRQQAEIQSLQHQIDPHYLFNTLETIRMKLVMKNDREDAEIVKLFADSFRRYVDIRDEYVSLLEEVAFIRKYIRIQNYRLNDKIRFTCVGDVSLLQYQIPKLLLQPLVENAVCHGLEEAESDGEIVLRVEAGRETLDIYVEDNGVGMAPEKLDTLRGMVFSAHPNRSVGLQNIYQRIRLTYGDRAKMVIDSIENIGTAVQLSLPLDVLEGR